MYFSFDIKELGRLVSHERARNNNIIAEVRV